MARQHYFSHTSPGGTTFPERIRRTGYLRGANEWFVGVNPVSHLVTAARELTTTGTSGVEVWVTLLASAAVVIVFAPLTVRAYMRRA